MRKALTVTLILALVPVVTGASADSIFPEMTPAPAVAEPASAAEVEAVSHTAPSYGMMADVASDEVSENAQGGAVVTYRKVTADDFNRFGAFLGDLGYTVTDTETQAGQTAYALSDGRTDFVVFFDLAGETLTLVYPKGVEYEEPLFPGYQSFRIGDTIRIRGLGDFRFTSFVMDGKAYCCGLGQILSRDCRYYYDAHGADMKRRAVHSWLEFDYRNTATEEKRFSEDANDLFDIALVYITDGTRYTFEPYSRGKAFGDNTIYTAYNPVFGETCSRQAHPVSPMSDAIREVIFDLPSGVTGSADGTLAVTIDFRTGEHYVLMLRNNGVSRFEAEPAE